MKQAYSFDDVLIVPQYSELQSRSECDISVPEFDLSIPIFAANMDTICGVKMARKMQELGGCGIIHRYMKVSETHNLIQEWFKDTQDKLFLAVGAIPTDRRRLDLICTFTKENSIGICIDIAHGDSKNMLDTINYIRGKFTGTLIAGNICTSEAASRLFDVGADIVKVGVGPGSACTTRLKSGCGFPQLAAIEECSFVGPIIADGGIKHPGDAAKALAVGAKAVMLGGMFAGTDCTPSWESNGSYVSFRGMASKEARTSCGRVPINAEGIATSVPKLPKGSTQEVVDTVVEGIKSAMSYSGCRSLKEFQLRSQIVHVTSTVREENRPHIEGNNDV